MDAGVRSKELIHFAPGHNCNTLLGRGVYNSSPDKAFEGLLGYSTAAVGAANPGDRASAYRHTTTIYCCGMDDKHKQGGGTFLT